MCHRFNHIYEEIPCRNELPSDKGETNQANKNIDIVPQSVSNEEISNNVEENVYKKNKAAKDQQEMDINIEMSPTADDTVYNRYFQFLLYTVTEFIQQACLAILVSTDKSNAKTSKFAKYLNKAVEVGVTGGISAIPGAAPLAKGAGKVAGELVEGIVKEYKESEQHKKAKLAEHLLTTFQPDDPKWIRFLLDGFSTIFIS